MFFTFSTDNSTEMEGLAREAEIFDDVVLVDLPEDYKHLPHKVCHQKDAISRHK